MGWQARRLIQEEAARLLGLTSGPSAATSTVMTKRAWSVRSDKPLARVSRRWAPVDEATRIEALYRECFEGWNVKHLYSFYCRCRGGERSHTRVKNRLVRWRVSLSETDNSKQIPVFVETAMSRGVWGGFPGSYPESLFFSLFGSC